MEEELPPPPLFKAGEALAREEKEGDGVEDEEALGHWEGVEVCVPPPPAPPARDPVPLGEAEALSVRVGRGDGVEKRGRGVAVEPAPPPPALSKEDVGGGLEVKVGRMGEGEEECDSVTHWDWVGLARVGDSKGVAVPLPPPPPLSSPKSDPGDSEGEVVSDPPPLPSSDNADGEVLGESVAPPPVEGVAARRGDWEVLGDFDREGEGVKVSVARGERVGELDVVIVFVGRGEREEEVEGVVVKDTRGERVSVPGVGEGVAIIPPGLPVAPARVDGVGRELGVFPPPTPPFSPGEGDDEVEYREEGVDEGVRREVGVGSCGEVEVEGDLEGEEEGLGLGVRVG